MPVRCERLRRDAHPRDATVEVEADPGFLMTYWSNSVRDAPVPTKDLP